MANTKISDLPAASVLYGDELIPIVQNGVTKQTTLAAIAAAAKDGAGPFDYYVDSVNGSDENDGTSAETAFATIGKLSTTVSNDFSGLRIGLARGSYWREQLGSQSNASANVVIAAYGAGKMPVLDAADVVAADSWAKTVGQTNVYEINWAHAASVGSILSVWEDSVRLRWVADVTTCDATPGTYHCVAVAGSTTTVYLHATGSGDPDSNGKAYEIARRDYGLVAGTNSSGWHVSNIRTKRPAHPDGSLVVRGPGSVVRRSIAEDGTKHNLFIGADCAAYDSIAWKCDWPDRMSSTFFVAYANAGPDRSARFERCIAIGDPDVAAVAVAAGKGMEGFYAHTAAVPGGNWKNISYIDCAVSGATLGASAADCEELIIERLQTVETALSARTAVPLATILDLSARDGAVVKSDAAVQHSGGSIIVEGLRQYCTTNSYGSIRSIAAGSVRVSKSVFARGTGGTGARYFVNAENAAANIESEHNIFVGTVTGDYGYAGPLPIIADSNVYYPATINFSVAGQTSNDFAAYRAAHPTLDVNSIAADPLLNDPANGDFGVDPSSPAIALGAGLERPNIVYTAIPSDEEIEAM